MNIPLTTGPFVHGSRVGLPASRQNFTHVRFDALRLAFDLGRESEGHDRRIAEKSRIDGIKALMRDAFAPGALRCVYQPIVRLQGGSIEGYEALARFDIPPQRTPDKWFADALQVDLAEQLELLAMRAALGALEVLPSNVYVGVNVSPVVAASGALGRVLDGPDLSRVVLEITEHAVVEEYKKLAVVLRPWRDRGLRLAVDDAGAGYASFRHIISLEPDIIKLDLGITRNIHLERPKRALAAALIRFAAETRSCVVAEGVECQEERDILLALGATFGQGYWFGKPEPLGQTTGRCELQRFECEGRPASVSG